MAGNGGWPMISERGLEKGDVSRQVVFLRERLVAEGYLPPESLAVDRPEKFSVEVRSAVKAFQSNHGLATTGKLDDRTLTELNIPAGARLQQLRAAKGAHDFSGVAPVRDRRQFQHIGQAELGHAVLRVLLEEIVQDRPRLRSIVGEELHPLPRHPRAPQGRRPLRALRAAAQALRRARLRTS